MIAEELEEEHSISFGIQSIISRHATQCGQTLMYVSLGVSSRKYNFLLSVCFVTINCQNWKISTKIRPTAHADTG